MSLSPDYRVSLGGLDITGRFSGRLIELRHTDADGVESDRLVIQVDNGDYAVMEPSKGAVLSLALGYVETGLVDKGQFTVDDLSYEEGENSPCIMTITAKAHDLRKDQKKQRNKSYDKEGQKLKDVLEEISGRMGVGLSLSPSLQSIPLAYWHQNNESDLHTIMRLARRHDLILKVTNGQLIGVKRTEGLNALGAALSGITITPDMCRRWSARLGDREDHSEVEAQWLNRAQGERSSVIIAEGGGSLGARQVLPQVYPTEDEARKAARTRKRELDSSRGSFSATLPGSPEITPETPLNTMGFPGSISGQPWMVKKVENVIVGSRTYETSVAAEIKPNGNAGKSGSSGGGSGSGGGGGGGAADPGQANFDNAFRDNSGIGR